MKNPPCCLAGFVSLDKGSGSKPCTNQEGRTLKAAPNKIRTRHASAAVGVPSRLESLVALEHRPLSILVRVARPEKQKEFY